jgi:hypothetical protein
MSAPLSLHNVPSTVRRKAELLDHEFTQIAGTKIRPALAALESKLHMDAESLKRWFYRWLKMPEGQRVAAVIDHRKCKGCGLPGCTVAAKITIPTETLDHWRAGYIGNDKRGLLESWQTRIIEALRKGESIPGLGTWQELHMKLHPFSVLPASCPWHIHNAPRGFSFSNFTRFKVAKSVYKLGQKGEFAAWSELPEVRVDLSGLRCLEWVVFDDHRIDAFCLVEDGRGGFQVVEMWGVFAMCVATRRVIAFGLKPKIERADGTKMGITRNDVQHLMASILARYGMPKDYDMTFIVENAAAAVTPETERMLTRVSRGRIKIKRSGLHTSDAMISGFPEKWGNYRGKAWLESWFNLFEIGMGVVKGQMGADYWVKPGRSDAEKQIAERMAIICGGMTQAQREKLTLPFEWAGDLHRIIAATIDAVDARTDHRCVGFEPVRFFCWNQVGDNQPKPLDFGLADLHGTRKELELFNASPTELQNMWLSYGMKRMESPHERFERLYEGGKRFVAIAEETYLHLFLNESDTGDTKGGAIQYKGGDCLDVMVKQGTRKLKARFVGRDHQLQIGQIVRVVYNSDNLEAGIFIVDEDGVQLGRMRYAKDPTHDDLEGLQRSLGMQQKALGHVTKELRRVMLKPENLRAQIEDTKTTLEVLSTVRAGAAEVAPASDESKGLVKAITGTKAKPRKTGILKASDLLSDDD